MVLIRDVVVVLVLMVLQIAHVYELAVASLLICVFKGSIQCNRWISTVFPPKGAIQPLKQVI